MRYPEQPLTENEERKRETGERKGRKERRREREGEKVRGMNLYREETKGEVCAERRRTVAHIYMYTTARTCIRARERKVKASV